MLPDRRPHPPAIRPMIGAFQALLLAFPVALFPAALVTDITYLNTAEIQWTNFSAWLLAAGELFAGLLLIAALVSLVRRRRGRAVVYFLLVLALFVVGLLNSFQHSGDGWASVGTFGLVLSILGAILALAAGALGYASRTRPADADPDWRRPVARDGTHPVEVAR